MRSARGVAILWAMACLSSAFQSNANSQEAAKQQRPGLKISGIVVDASTGKAIEKFRMVPAPQEPNSKHFTWQSHLVKTFEHGQFLWNWERPWDNSRIRIDADGYRPFISEAINRTAGEFDVKVQLQPDAGINGTVIAPDGTPAAGAQAAICTWTNEISVEGGKLRFAGHGSWLGNLAKTADDGSFHLPAEIDPWLLVVADDSGYAELTAAEFEKSSEVQLKPWGKLEVKYAPAGKAVAEQAFHVGSGRGDVEVMLHYSETAKTDDEGKFSIERLPPVDVYVQPFFKMGDTMTGSLLHFSGETKIEAGKTKRLIVPRPGQTIVGQMVVPADSELKLSDFEFEVCIRLRPPGISGFQDMVQNEYAAYNKFMASETANAFKQDHVPLNEDGRFAIAGLPETEYVLQIQGTEKKSHAENLGRRQLTAWHARRVKVPPRPVSAEALDLGEIKLELKEMLAP